MAQLHGSVSAGGGGRGWGAGWPAAPTGGSGGQGSVWVCKGGSPGQEGATLGAVAPLGAGREAACGGQRAGSPGGWTVLAPGVVVCARTTITPLRPWELRPGSGLSLRGVEPGQQFLPPSRGEGLGRPGPQGTWLRQVEPCGGEPADRRRSQATEAQSSGSARFAHGPRGSVPPQSEPRSVPTGPGRGMGWAPGARSGAGASRKEGLTLVRLLLLSRCPFLSGRPGVPARVHCPCLGLGGAGSAEVALRVRCRGPWGRQRG